jgi:predicted ATPase
MPTFAELLRGARLRAGLTQETLAERASMSVRGISDLERGIHQAPRRDTLDLLSEALELSVDERRTWERVRSGSDARTAAPTAESPAAAGNLPQPLTAIFGRNDEISRLAALLRQSEVRLVTVTGPGGVGKTRLALAVAHAALDDRPEGVWFLPLAAVADPGLVLPSIAGALEIQMPAGQPVGAALANALRGKRVLLVLDNLEQIVAAAPDIADLLGQCPQLTILTTSRIPLRVTGEQEFPLDPLELPRESELVDLAELEELPSLKLFMARARAVRPDFDLTEENASAIVAICRRLDGLPLALELAAARIRLLSPQAMLERLERRLPLLHSDARDIPDRHRTLADTIAWSYNLLTPAEQQLFRALSVFRGGWTLDGAEALMTGSSQRTAGDTLHELESLIASNLVRMQEMPGIDARFSMLETIREFGLESLAATGEGASIRKAHLRYFIDLAQTIYDATHGPDQTIWLNRGDQEHNNIRAALDWSLEHEPLEALRLSCAMSEYWLFRGNLDEGLRWLDASWQAAENPPEPLRALALLFRGEFRYWTGDYEPANAMVDESIALYRALGDHFGLGLALHCRGRGAWFQGDFDAAYVFATGSLEAFTEIDNVWGIGGALGHLGVITHRQGKLDQARQFLERALALDRTQHDLLGIVVWLSSLGDLAIDVGDYDLARERYREMLLVNRQVRHARMTVRCLEGLATVAGIRGQHEESAQLFGAASRDREITHIPLSAEEVADFERRRDLARSGADEVVWTAAWESGRNLSLEKAIALALKTANSPS